MTRPAKCREHVKQAGLIFVNRRDLKVVAARNPMCERAEQSEQHVRIIALRCDTKHEHVGHVRYERRKVGMDAIESYDLAQKYVV